MGIYDFSCAVYSCKGKEGLQTLECPQISAIEGWSGAPTEDDSPVAGVFDVEDGLDDDEKEDYIKHLMGLDEIPNPFDPEFSLYQWCGGGCRDAVLEVVYFPEVMVVTIENFAQLVRNGDYSHRFFEQAEYSWDEWDFTLKTNSDVEKYMNYRDSTDGAMTSVWKVRSSPDYGDLPSPHVLQSAAECGMQVWVRNYSGYAYYTYIASNNLTSETSNVDLAYTAYLFDIDYRTLTRIETFTAIRMKMTEHFGF